MTDTERSDRKAQRASRTRVSRPGGITAACGCIYARTGGRWLQITPCRRDRLRTDAVTDEEMRAIGAGARR